MAFASEEVTRSWQKKKGLIIRSRPRQSNFSFAVCLSVVAALLCGFLGGFVSAGFALGENYGAVYEGLITELESTRQCIEREKNELKSLREAHLARANMDFPSVKTAARATLPGPGNQVQDQAILSVFDQAVKIFINKN